MRCASFFVVRVRGTVVLVTPFSNAAPSPRERRRAKSARAKAGCASAAIHAAIDAAAPVSGAAALRRKYLVSHRAWCAPQQASACAPPKTPAAIGPPATAPVAALAAAPETAASHSD